MNNIPLLFCFDKNFIVLFKIAVYSLYINKKQNTKYDICVAHSNLTPQQCNDIIKFINKKTKDITVEFIIIDNNLLNSLPKWGNRESKAIYLPLIAPYFFDKYEKFIYSDADVLFLDDLSDIYHTKLGNYALGVVQFNHKQYFTDKLIFDGKYFASGQYIINRERYLKAQPLTKLKSFFSHYSTIYPDQDFLNYIFYDNVKYLPLNFCVNYKLYTKVALELYLTIHCTNYSDKDIVDALENPILVHFTGKKPDHMSPEECPLWHDYYNRAELSEIENDINNNAIGPYIMLSKNNFSAGKMSYHNGNFLIQGKQELTIGNYCTFGKNITIITEQHDYNFPALLGVFYKHYFNNSHPGEIHNNIERTKGPVHIGSDVWIGHGVIILSGTTIGDGAIIGAKSLVIKDVEPFSIVGGVPAKKLKMRFSKEKIEYLNILQWWKWTDEQIKMNQRFFMANLNKLDLQEIKQLISL